MEVIISRKQLLNSFNQINELMKRESNFKFSYAIVQLKKSLIDIVKEVSKELDIIEQKRTDLCLKYCEKDKDGNPIVENKMYKGLELGINKEFDDQMIAQKKETEAYLDENIKVNGYYIKSQYVPDSIIPHQHEAILPFIIEEKTNNDELSLN